MDKKQKIDLLKPGKLHHIGIDFPFTVCISERKKRFVLWMETRETADAGCEQNEGGYE